MERTEYTDRFVTESIDLAEQAQEAAFEFAYDRTPVRSEIRENGRFVKSTLRGAWRDFTGRY